MGMETLRVMGRNTQGVRLIRINDGDSISSVAKIDIEPEIADGATEEAPAIDPNLIITAENADILEDAVDLDEEEDDADPDDGEEALSDEDEPSDE
jgi:DNA gyrase subunit A